MTIEVKARLNGGSSPGANEIWHINTTLCSATKNLAFVHPKHGAGGVPRPAPDGTLTINLANESAELRGLTAELLEREGFRVVPSTE